MALRVFYCFYGTGETVTEPRPTDAADLVGYVDRLTHDRDFVGVVDDGGTTLQVMYEADDDRYWVEIPVPKEGGSYGRHLDHTALRALFMQLPERFEPGAFDGLRFEAW
ncbi:MAG: hypothetical protein H6722_31150 [Sandaracinus sp.]|nr:hypothetical protein [Sandaracinus sp.]MCB9622803.1 hypothetical protein [Sandaracinus sp.]